MRPLADAVSGFIFFTVPVAGAELPLIVVWLICAGLFFTFYLRLVNIRGFKHAVDLVRGKHKAPGDPGEISQFQALTTAVSGTVGIGNIAGVAVAISLGGPGATLWLIVAGLLGMSTKLAECTLAVKYRRERDGQVSGGPMTLSGARPRGPQLAWRGPCAGPVLRRRHGDRLPRHRQHVSVQPGHRHPHRRHRRGQQCLRRPRLAGGPAVGQPASGW